jgi:hypothetical protein
MNNYPRSLAKFKIWLKPGNKLLYEDKVYKVRNVKSQVFDMIDEDNNVVTIPVVIGENKFSGKNISLNGRILQFCD